MFKKLLELEQKIFSAPYKWLVKKGIVTVLATSKNALMKKLNVRGKKTR